MARLPKSMQEKRELYAKSMSRLSLAPPSAPSPVLVASNSKKPTLALASTSAVVPAVPLALSSAPVAPANLLNPLPWTEVQDSALKELVARNTFNNGFIDFDKVWWELRSRQKLIPHRGSKGCKDRWNVLQEGPVEYPSSLTSTVVDSGKSLVRITYRSMDLILHERLAAVNLGSISTNSRAPPPPPPGPPPPEAISISIPLVSANNRKLFVPQKARSPSPPVLPFSLRTYLPGTVGRFLPTGPRPDLESNRCEVVSRSLSPLTDIDLESYGSRDYQEDDLEEAERIYREEMWELRTEPDFYDQSGGKSVRNIISFLRRIISISPDVGIASDEEPVEVAEQEVQVDSEASKIAINIDEKDQAIDRASSRKRSPSPVEDSEHVVEQPSSPKRARINSPRDRASISPPNSAQALNDADTSIPSKEKSIPSSLPAFRVVRISTPFLMPEGYQEAIDAWIRCAKVLDEEPFWQ